MPRYTWTIEEILFEEDVKKMFEVASNKTEKALISILWLTGARTSEILMLKREDIQIQEDKFSIFLHTLKLGADQSKFKVRERTLEFSRPRGMDIDIYGETIINYAESLAPGSQMFLYSPRWAEKVINRIGDKTIGKRICPYHFRHSVLTHHARNGMTIEGLKYWKGAASVQSVETYLHAVPQVVIMENLRRNRIADTLTRTREPEQPKTEPVKEEPITTENIEVVKPVETN